MAKRIQTAFILLAGVFLLSLVSAAQVTVGNDITLNANGTVSAGYNGTYGNEIESSHGLGFGGSGALNGFFYNPNFLSFNINPYYNQSRSNSTMGSVTDASGVAINTAVFAGSHTPGSINYATNFNSTGSYGVPGITSLSTNGNNQTFGINWGAYFPGLPTLSVGYQQGDSNYSLYGTDENGSSNFKSFNVNSSYNLFGFGLSGAVAHGNSNSLIPGVVLNGQTATTNSDTTTYALGLEHPLPWSGTLSSAFNRTDLNSDYLGYNFNGNIDTLTGTIGLHPSPKLSFSLGSYYTDNFSGSLYEAIVPGASGSNLAGGAGVVQNQASSSTTTNGGLLPTASDESSHAFSFLFNTAYSFAENLQANGQFERRQQSYSGLDYGSNLYSAGVTYTRQIMGGYLGSSASVIDSTTDSSSQNNLGFTITTNYGRRIGEWQVGGFCNYAQNVETFLVTYNTSYYNFSGLVSRQFGKWYWSAAGSGAHSLLVQQAGSGTGSESFSTNLTSRHLSFGGAYSKADGNALASGAGLINTPIPPIIPSNLLVTYAGTAYSFSVSASPIYRLTLAASYVKSKNDINNTGLSSWNNYEQENVYLTYQFRQLGINGGYTRLVQGFSASPLPPANVSSFAIGIYRWFNFF